MSHFAAEYLARSAIARSSRLKDSEGVTGSVSEYTLRAGGRLRFAGLAYVSVVTVFAFGVKVKLSDPFAPAGMTRVLLLSLNVPPLSELTVMVIAFWRAPRA
jgi:hypothetical protein